MAHKNVVTARLLIQIPSRNKDFEKRAPQACEKCVFCVCTCGCERVHQTAAETIILFAERRRSPRAVNPFGLFLLRADGLTRRWGRWPRDASSRSSRAVI